jgi:lysozyme family protein
MTDIPSLIARNGARWNAMHIKADRLPAFEATGKRLCAAKARYVAIANKTGVPWFIVAVIHEREAGGPPHWDTQLGQGDPLARKSTHDPKGRGPWRPQRGDTDTINAFYRCAIDALTKCAPHAARWTDWSAGGALTLLEEYNGLGYAARGVPSAYVWSGSDQYVSGKFIADHVYRKNAKDVQEGCAPLIACMTAIDPSVQFAE